MRHNYAAYLFADAVQGAARDRKRESGCRNYKFHIRFDLRINIDRKERRGERDESAALVRDTDIHHSYLLDFYGRGQLRCAENNFLRSRRNYFRLLTDFRQK